MGRVFESIITIINGAIERGHGKHGEKSLKRDETKIICVKCDESISYTRNNVNSRVSEHLKSKKHQANKSKKSSSLIKDQFAAANQRNQSEDQFKEDLLDMFLSCDIPLHKLKHDKMKQFLNKYIPDRTVPHPDTLRNRIENQALTKIEAARTVIGDSDVYMQVDETSDRKSRNVVNIMVGKLDGTTCKPMLLHTEFQHFTNSKTIQTTILNACNVLWPTKNRYPKLKLIVSDQAAYMILACKEMKDMKLIFPNLCHVTCINHAISLVCNSIQKEFFLVNTLFSNLKTWFSHSNKRKKRYQTSTKQKLIPLPVAIRWGTWIECANYHRNHLESIRKYFNDTVEPKNSEVLYRIKKILSGKKIEDDIIKLTENYGEIPKIITQLEGECLKTSHQLELLKKVEDMIKGTSHAQILNRSLQKNPDFKNFTSSDVSFNEKVKRIYTPLTSCSVERSFSVYRAILRDNRTHITNDNLRNMLLIKMNHFI